MFGFYKEFQLHFYRAYKQGINYKRNLLSAKQQFMLAQISKLSHSATYFWHLKTFN